MQPVVSSVASTVNLAAIKPQHTALLNSPLTHSLGPSIVSNQQVSNDFSREAFILIVSAIKSI